MDAVGIFERYESIRARFPHADFPGKTRQVSSLIDIVPEVDAFVFDAFGVLNVGEEPIPGAADRLDELRSIGCRIRILSNAASYDHEAAQEKFRRLGMTVSSDEIVTSRDATLASLDDITWGCIATDDDELTDIPATAIRLGDDPAQYDRVDGILFLSTHSWTERRQDILRESLLANQRPVIIANADLAAPRGDSFSKEPGHFGHLLIDAGVTSVEFFGKPFHQVFDRIAKTLPGISPARIAMCGDTLHTDILGARARGWKTVLVTRDGMFAGHDAGGFSERSGIIPDWRLQRI